MPAVPARARSRKGTRCPGHLAAVDGGRRLRAGRQPYLGRHAAHVVTGSVARAVMCADTRRELDGGRVDRSEHPRGLGDRKPPPALELAGRGGHWRRLPLHGTAHDHRVGKERNITRGDPPDMVGVQMSEEDSGDIGRRDTGCSQRAGQQPSCGNRLRRIREPGRGGNIVGERDAGRPEASIHENGQARRPGRGHLRGNRPRHPHRAWLAPHCSPRTTRPTGTTTSSRRCWSCPGWARPAIPAPATPLTSSSGGACPTAAGNPAAADGNRPAALSPPKSWTGAGQDRTR